MKKLTLICMTLIAMIGAVSCRGPQGPAGHDGNANVVSTTITIPSNKWKWDSNTSWRVDIEYKAISADIVDHGAVLVYMEDRNTWRQIPYTFYYSKFVDDVEYFYSSSLELSIYDDGLSIFWTENNFSDEYRPAETRFKIVVIAANYYTSRSDVDYSNYEAVKEAFQLKDDDIVCAY